MLLLSMELRNHTDQHLILLDREAGVARPLATGLHHQLGRPYPPYLPMHFAAVEGGGQSSVCALASGRPDNIVESAAFPTLDPARTLGEIKAWLLARKDKIRGIGIATFGPIDARPSSSRFGCITSTPKEGRGDTNVLRELGVFDEFSGIPYRFDTDVNAPAYTRVHCLSQSVE